MSDDGQCLCAVIEDCDALAYCITADEPLAEFDCNPNGKTCANAELQIEGWLERLIESVRPDGGGFGDYEEPVRQRVVACIQKVCSELVCNDFMASECAEYGF